MINIISLPQPQGHFRHIFYTDHPGLACLLCGSNANDFEKENLKKKFQERVLIHLVSSPLPS